MLYPKGRKRGNESSHPHLSALQYQNSRTKQMYPRTESLSGINLALREVLYPPTPGEWGRIPALVERFLDEVQQLPFNSPERLEQIPEFANHLTTLVETTMDVRLWVVSLEALLSIGPPGPALCSNFVLSDRISPQQVSIIIAKIGRKSRLALVCELLRLSENNLSTREKLIKQVLSQIPSFNNTTLLEFLEGLAESGEIVPVSLQKTILKTGFAEWLEEQAKFKRNAEDHRRICKAAQALGTRRVMDAILLLGTKSALDFEAAVFLLRTAARNVSQDTPQIGKALCHFLKTNELRVRNAVLEALVDSKWAHAGKILKEVFVKAPSMRNFLLPNLLLLSEESYSQFRASFSCTQWNQIIPILFAYLANLSPDFTLHCLDPASPQNSSFLSDRARAAIRKYIQHVSQESAQPPLKAPELRVPSAPEKRSSKFSFLPKLFRPRNQDVLALQQATLPSGLDMSGRDIPKLKLKSKKLSSLTMNACCFDKSSLKDCQFSDCDLSKSVHKNSIIKGCDFKRVNFDSAIFKNTKFISCRFILCSFASSQLENIEIEECELVGCFFHASVFFECKISTTKNVRSVFTSVHLFKSDIRACFFNICSFSLGIFSKCKFQGCEFDRTMFPLSRWEECRVQGCIWENCMAMGAKTASLEADDHFLLGLKLKNTQEQVRLELAGREVTLPPRHIRNEESLEFMKQAIDEWCLLRQASSNMQAMLEHNFLRLQLAQQKMAPQNRIFLQVLPFLLDSRFFSSPEYFHAGSPTCVSGFFPTYSSSVALKDFFSETNETQGRDPLQIRGIYTIGSLGSNAQSSESDIDVWICTNTSHDSSKQIKELSRLLKNIEEWAAGKFGLEVHFFLMSLDDIRNNDFGMSGKESSGSAQALLLKEEFYRTTLKIAGDNLAWWMAPPGASKKNYERFVDTTARHEKFAFTRTVDTGALEHIPMEEYFGACLWQLVKSTHSPFKSVMKLGLLECYALSRNEHPQLLCEKIKTSILKCGHNIRLFDPYVTLFYEVESFYQRMGDTNAAQLMRKAFHHKLKASTGEIEPPPPTARDWPSEPEFFRQSDVTSWSFKKNMHLAKMINSYMMGAYNRIQKALVEKNVSPASISPEDLTKLGRIIAAAFAPRPHKVLTLPFIKQNMSPLKEIALSADRAAGRLPIWEISGRRAGVSAKRSETIGRNTNLVRLLVWLVANGLYSEDTKVFAKNNISPLSVEDVETTLRTFHNLLADSPPSAPDMNEYLNDEYAERVCVVLNLTAARDSQKVQQTEIVYSTNWREFFVISPPPSGGMIQRSVMAFLRQTIPIPLAITSRTEILIPKKSLCPKVNL